MGSGSPIVPMALHFTPQKKRVRFSDSFEMEGPLLKVPASAPPRTRARAAEEAECAEDVGWYGGGPGVVPVTSKSAAARAGEQRPPSDNNARRGAVQDGPLKLPDEAPQSSAQSQGSAFSAAEDASAVEKGTYYVTPEEDKSEQDCEDPFDSLVHGAPEETLGVVAEAQDEHAALRLSDLESAQTDFRQGTYRCTQSAFNSPAQTPR